MLKAVSLLFRLSFCTLGYLYATTTATSAQITSDGTVNTQVTPDGNVAEITGGETRGDNLFHSFQDFSIPKGNEAFFNNAESIANIFSRVTGGNISNIDGLIGANGSANLFLINPAGILFGENASLNLGGSFYGSTADSILFESGEFSATNLDSPPLLTINAPIGLNLRDNPGEIVNRSTVDGVGLQVSTGESISLIGGDINLEGGLITAPGGTIQLGGLSQTGTVSIADDGSLNFPSDVIKGNVFLSDNAVASITANGGGSISVNANNLELTGDSLIEASIGFGLGSENAVAGTIEIATDTLQIDNNSAIVASTFGRGDAGTINITARNIAIEQEFSGIYSNVGLSYIATEDAVADAVGNGGEININTDTLSLTDGARITSNSVATGDAGDININATGEVLYSGVGTTPVPVFGGGTVISGSFSQVQQNGVGSSGQVKIKAGSLTLTDTGAVLVDNSGQQGNAGDITLDIENEIFLDGALILSQLQQGAIGNGGDIDITANSLVARNSSLILADTKGQGNAGNITINADEAISLEDSTIINSFVEKDAIGNGGDISLVAGELNLTNFSEINADTAGKGNAGNVSVEVAGDIRFDNGSKIQSQTRGNATGNAGNIIINAGGSLISTNGNSILADSQAQGDSGDITITAKEQILLEDGTRINNLVEQGAIGNGGDISLVAGELNLTNFSEINADTAGKGNAGNVSVEVAGDIRFDNGSKIQSQTRGNAIGNAGNITINGGGSLTFANGSFIFADSQAQGDGGKIAIVVEEQILLEGFSVVNNDPNPNTPSQIVAGLSRENAVGRGGDIEITADSLVLNEAASISSNTILGSKGTAGDITANVDSLQIKENSLINVFTGNEDPGGAVIVNARTVDLTNGGKILAATTGEGNAGNIDLNVTEQIEIDGVESSTRYISNQSRLQFLDDLQDEPSGIYANTIEGSTGDGGNINIEMSGQTPVNFVIRNNGQIIVNSNGEGSGGNISLKSQSLELDNGAKITASTRFGEGGTINLEIDTGLILDRNSFISAQAFGEANGGNLNIDARYIFAFPSNGIGNDLVATAEKGKGGDININAEQIFGLEVGNAIDAQNNFIPNNNNDIDVSGNFDGNITINTTRVNNIQEPTELPQNTVDLEETIAQACQRDRVAAAKNSFSIKGQGGIIPEPGSPLNSSNIYVNGNDSTSAIPKPIETAQGKIQPARGIKVTESGEIILTAYHTDNAGERLPKSDRNCGV